MSHATVFAVSVQVLEMLASKDDKKQPSSSTAAIAVIPTAAPAVGGNANNVAKRAKTFGADDDDDDAQAAAKRSLLLAATAADDEEDGEVLVTHDDEEDWADISDDREDSMTRKKIEARKQAAQLSKAQSSQLASAVSGAAAVAAALQAKILAQTSALNESLRQKQQQQQQSATTVAGADDEAARKERLRALVDKIPTDPAALFAQPVQWALLHKQNVIQGHLREWIVKKIVEYLGEEEESLTSFIVDKLQQPQGIAATELQEELTMVLDADSETFVVKLWKMLMVYSLKCEHGL